MLSLSSTYIFIIAPINEASIFIFALADCLHIQIEATKDIEKMEMESMGEIALEVAA